MTTKNAKKERRKKAEIRKNQKKEAIAKMAERKDRHRTEFKEFAQEEQRIIDAINKRLGYSQAKRKEKSAREIKQPLLKREIGALKSEGKTYTLSLADIVMVQMTGRFEDFLNSLPSNGNTSMEEAKKFIKETRDIATTQKVFKSIVEKTIEAQIGDKHATLRELGQNGMDSYDLADMNKKVQFDLKSLDDYLILRARDYGCAMDMKALVRDLLIPYNSGKEFDANKIGEHGIGWYTIVDIADLVKVTTRKKDMDKSIQSLIYRKENDWLATINPNSDNGFYKDMHIKDNGTEVCAYIPKKVTTATDIINFMFQYLGMVEKSKAKILLHNMVVNNVRSSYIEGAPVNVNIDRNEKPLVVGVSKRELSASAGDIRFKHRNKNLSKILYTQRGLFIKYDSNPFHEETTHHQLLEELIGHGLDFWVDVPEHATLTKGRNNIIADHSAAVLDGTYQGFENVFLDVLLDDEELVTSPLLLNSIANLFDRKYDKKVARYQKRGFSLSRRIAANAAAFGSFGVDMLSAFAELGVMGVGYVCRLPVRMTKSVKRGCRDMYEAFKEWDAKQTAIGIKDYLVEKYRGFKKGCVSLGKGIKSAIKATPGTLENLVIKFAKGSANVCRKHGLSALKYTGGAIGALGALGAAGVGGYYGVRALYAAAGWYPFIGAGIAAGAGLFGWGAYKIGVKIKNIEFDPIAIKSGYFGRVGRFFKDSWLDFVHSIGLYTDVEKKRERKRARQKRRIAKKYIRRMAKDEFLKRIMGKKIIPAEHYYSLHTSKSEKEEVKKNKTFKNFFKDAVYKFKSISKGVKEGDDLIGALGHSIFPYKTSYYKDLQADNVKISIDELIGLYLTGKLVRKEGDKYEGTITDGAYAVSQTNPIVAKVVSKLEETCGRVKGRYNVKVLEDHLDNLWKFASSTAAVMYFFSGVGIAHVVLSCISDEIKNPYSDLKIYTDIRDGLLKLEKGAVKGINGAYELGCGAAKVGGIAIDGALDILENHKMDALKYTAIGAGVLGVFGVALGVGLGALAVYVPYKVGRFGVENVAWPLAKAANPLKYPGYIQSIRKARAEFKEARRRIREREKKQRRIENLIKQREKSKKKKRRIKDLVSGVRQLFSILYEDGLLQAIAGYEQGTGLRKFSMSRLENVVEKINAGQAYVNFCNAVKEIDKVVSQALEKKPFKLELTYDTNVRNYYQGFILEKKGKLRVDMLDASSLIKMMNPKWLENKHWLTSATYSLLDALVHQRAHDEFEKYEHLFRNNSEHKFHKRGEEEFYTVKADLRRKIIDYIIQNKISLTDIVKKKADKGRDSYNIHIYPLEFCKLAYASNRKLLKERENIKKNRQKEVGREVFDLEDMLVYFDNEFEEKTNRISESLQKAISDPKKEGLHDLDNSMHELMSNYEKVSEFRAGFENLRQVKYSLDRAHERISRMRDGTDTDLVQDFHYQLTSAKGYNEKFKKKLFNEIKQIKETEGFENFIKHRRKFFMNELYMAKPYYSQHNLTLASSLARQAEKFLRKPDERRSIGANMRKTLNELFSNCSQYLEQRKEKDETRLYTDVRVIKSRLNEADKELRELIADPETAERSRSYDWAIRGLNERMTSFHKEFKETLKIVKGYSQITAAGA